MLALAAVHAGDASAAPKDGWYRCWIEGYGLMWCKDICHAVRAPAIRARRPPVSWGACRSPLPSCRTCVPAWVS